MNTNPSTHTHTHTHTHIYIYVYIYIYIYIYIYLKEAHILTYTYTFNRLMGQMGRVFTNGPGDQGSIPGRVIPKTLKMILDTSLLNTQQFKIFIKGKVEQSRERSSALPYKSV